MKNVPWKLLWVLPLVLVAGGCRESKPVAPPPQVGIHTVTKSPITIAVPAVGEAKASDSVNLVPRVQGFLRKRNFQEGARVKAGQTLFLIEPELYEAKVKAAEAAVEKARAGKTNADSDYLRQKELTEKDATSVRVFENAKAKKMESDADLKSAEAELATAKLNLGYTRMTAPFDGWVGLSAVSEGNLVKPDSGALATLLKTDPMRVEFVLNELDLLRLLKYRHAPTDMLTVRLRFQDGTTYGKTGKISFWDNRLSASTGTLKLQALFDNAKGELISGMFVRVSLEPAKPAEELLVPLLALMDDLTGEYVYTVAADGTVRRTQIKTGYKDDTFAVVESGLKAGDRVIVTGTQGVRPGSKATVKPATVTPATEKPVTSPAAAPKTGATVQ